MTRKRKVRTVRKEIPLDLAHSTGHLIKVAHRSFQQTLQAQLTNHEIKLSHWHCLRYLFEEEGLTQRELSKRVNVRESTLVAVILDMESAGFINRIRDSHDRRKYVVRLTDKGRRTTKKLLPLAKKVNDLAAYNFTKADIKLYHSMTQKIIANLNGDD